MDRGRKVFSRPLATALAFGALLGFSVVAGSSGGVQAAGASTRVGGITAKPGYLVYWDQNEEEDFLYEPSGLRGQLLPAWDINGQVCVLPDRSGRFVGGYDPTLPAQHNLGGVKPYKQPAIGEELDDANGAFSGQTLYVPGPFKMKGQSIGGDSPASANGVFNNNSTYTGCAFANHANLFATDIATAQGAYPPPSDGRLVEWFAPTYKTYCIVYGPDSGGVGVHHVDGTGGLSQPGMLAVMPGGDLLVPNAGSDEVLRFEHSSLPKSAASCPHGVYPRSKLRISVFFKGSGIGSSVLPFPAGVALDPTCGCYAISSYFGSTAIAWFTPTGQPEPGRSPVPGTPISQLGSSPDQYNPFGIAFAPDGTLYFVDIHITCTSGLSGCGPQSYGGRIMRVTFADGQPSKPDTVAGGFDFPTSVTVCVPARTKCPYPTGRIEAPLSGPSENPAPDKGPMSDAPGTAGFG